MKAIILLITALSISACAPLETIPTALQTASVPVSRPCLDQDKAPPRPELVTDAALLALDDGRFVIALAADRLERMDYEGKLEAAVAGCVGRAPIPAGTVVPATPEARPWWRFW